MENTRISSRFPHFVFGRARERPTFSSQDLEEVRIQNLGFGASIAGFHWRRFGASTSIRGSLKLLIGELRVPWQRHLVKFTVFA
jgi:hypothetical protein